MAKRYEIQTYCICGGWVNTSEEMRMSEDNDYTPYLLSVDSGRVETEEDWISEMPTWEIYIPPEGYTPEQEEEERRRQFDLLVRVKKVEGCWVEAYPTQKS